MDSLRYTEKNSIIYLLSQDYRHRFYSIKDLKKDNLKLGCLGKQGLEILLREIYFSFMERKRNSQFHICFDEKSEFVPITRVAINVQDEEQKKRIRRRLKEYARRFV